MDVAIYCDCDSRGGVLSYTLSLSSALLEAGVNIHIFTHVPKNSFQEAIVREMEDSCTKVEQLPHIINSYKDSQCLAERLIHNKSINIFIPNYRQVAYGAAAIISRKSNIKSIGLCHNDHSSSYDQKIRYSACLSKIICASNKTANKLTALMPERKVDIVNIPHGVRITEKSCRHFVGGNIRLIYHGRLTEQQKRISLLIKVAFGLKEAGIPFRLTFIGEGEAKEKCLMAAENPIFENQIEVIDSMGWNSLQQYLQECHVSVSVSEYEGFCLSLAEAMGAGLPAISFRSGGVIEQFVIHEKTGLLVNQEDIDGFVTAIERLQSNPKLWSELSVSGRQLIESKYSWSAVVKKYISLFEDVMSLDTIKKWPLFRPVWIKPGVRTIASINDKLGSILGMWK